MTKPFASAPLWLLKSNARSTAAVVAVNGELERAPLGLLVELAGQVDVLRAVARGPQAERELRSALVADIGDEYERLLNSPREGKE